MKMFIGSGPSFLESIGVGSIISNLDFINKNKDKIKFVNIYQLFDLDFPIFFILYKDFEILAVLKTQKSAMATIDFPFIGINFCSVKESYQGIGLARQLYETMFKYYSNEFIVGTYYETEDSEIKLKKMSYRLAKENNVYFLDRKKLASYESYEELPSKEELYFQQEYA